jgi:hypothetical protein
MWKLNVDFSNNWEWNRGIICKMERFSIGSIDGIMLFCSMNKNDISFMRKISP